MNNNQQEKNIIELLQYQKNVQPSEALFIHTLNKLPLASPYQKSTYISSASRIKKFSIASVVVVLFFTGGLFLNYKTNKNQLDVQNKNQMEVSQSNTSLEQDLQTIDSEMDGLNSDGDSLDQSLNT